MAKHVACLVVLALCVGLAAAKPASAAAPSPKVKATLDLLQRNPSLQEFGDALKRAGFTRAELQELDKEMRDPRYGAALRMLRQKAENAPYAGPPPVPSPLGLQAVRETLRQKHATLLARLQSQAQPGLQHVAGVVQSPARRLDPALAALGPALQLVRHPGNQSPVDLERTDPEPAVTDVWLVVFGHQLGRQGQVTIIVGAEDPRPENAFACRISGWGSEAIHAMVPVEIEELHRSRPFPNGQRSALVWVRPDGDPSGRWRQITVKLNPSHFVPQIESVSPSELTPGLRFALRGRDLSAGSRPRVWLHSSLSNASRDLQVLGYDADWVEVLVPESLEGLRPGRATLRISNGLSDSQPFGVDFTPTEEVVEVNGASISAACYSMVGTFGDVIGLDFLNGLCMWGMKLDTPAFERIEHDGVVFTRLRNDWKVVSAGTSASDQAGRGAGCYLEHAPAAGATEFTATQLFAWANGFCHVTCRAKLTISGPRGVPIAP